MPEVRRQSVIDRSQWPYLDDGEAWTASLNLSYGWEDEKLVALVTTLNRLQITI